MVCSLGSGRMAVMARFLASGSFSQTTADDFVRQKSAAEYICRELREADEANFLDEEDMHVYGLKPMTDPLQLVCCNACKKPIKDSQFAAHAELCRSLKLTEQTILEVDGNSVNRKPPRILKKKLSTSCANQATVVGERRRSESMDTSDTSVSGSRLNRQIRVTFFSNEAKGWQTHIFLYQNVLEKNLEQQKLRVSQMELLASVQLHVVKAGICGKELFQNMEILTIKILGWSTSNSSSRKIFLHRLLQRNIIRKGTIVCVLHSVIFISRTQVRNYALVLPVQKHQMGRWLHSKIHVRGTLHLTKWITCSTRRSLFCLLIRLKTKEEKYVK